MTKHKHTSGPWEIERYSDGLLQIVGDVRIVSDDEEHATTVVEAVSHGNQANAKLIAAAPDLLAAAERALAKLDHPTNCVTALDADALRDAIAKATE